MTEFPDLPLELLPIILRHVVCPSHLAALSLVNKSFHGFVVPQLYERAFIYAWHKEGKVKVIRLFRTLSQHSHLAKYVRQLGRCILCLGAFPRPTDLVGACSSCCVTAFCRSRTSCRPPVCSPVLDLIYATVIRDFPKALQSADSEDARILCLKGIQNCINLRSCTWTRDGSLTSAILETLLLCPQLEELEINGHHHGNYDPRILTKFTNLRRIVLIMPSGPVIDTLPVWARHTAGTLRHLSLICKSSPLLNDGLLETLAPSLASLDHLYIVGCPKVTDEGLSAVLAANEKGLLSLGMEGLSSAFDIARFAQQCTHTDALRSLRSITLAVNTQTDSAWETHVRALLSPAPIEQFHISTVGGEVGPALGTAFCSDIVNVHGERLRRFSVHRMRMNITAIEDICRRCPQLEQLFVVVEQHVLEALGPCLAQAPSLRAVHVNRPLDVMSGDVPMVSRDRILSIVKQCGPHLVQFGYNTRVWQVERVTSLQEDGSVTVDVRLSSYESPEIPEQFLVVRT
ncbi:hypothetical protein AcW1_002655 [Taiwanofungus camphoratus]|nr:hypothetical protein AcW1_002655 [Antrodia cinnamomea]